MADFFRENLTQKRIRWASLVLSLALFLLVFRLFSRSVIEHAKFVELGKAQYTTQIEEQARRGEIFVQNKLKSNDSLEGDSPFIPLATNLTKFQIIVIPRNIQNKEEVAKKIGPLLEMETKELFEKINNQKLYIPPLKKRVEKPIADQITAFNFSGILVVPEIVRFYPEKELAAHLLGFVNYEGEGNYGIEQYYNEALKGISGKLLGLKDNLGRIISVEGASQAHNGTSLVLTIDQSVQYMAEKKLKEGIERFSADGGTIIIMEPKTGNILAMASFPSYDPNKFNEVSKDKESIFWNPALSLAWEPGSVFKPMVVAAALDNKILEPDSKPEEPFSNFVTVQGYEIHNALDKPYGFETVSQIIENSDNVGMVWVANKIGDEKMGSFLEKLGFGKKTGVDLAGEATGQLSSWQKWREVNRATMSFGQGISVTPLQLITAYGAIANKGKEMAPRIVDKVLHQSGETSEVQSKEIGQVMSEETATKITGMLVSVVERGHGKKAQVEGFKVAGKTGTAQVPKAEGGYEEGTHIGSFAGFAPAEDPRFVMLVKFDKPKNVEFAESSAAPIFGELAGWLLKNYFK